MEQYSYYPQVTAVPLPGEKAMIKKQYAKIAVVLLVNVLIFNVGAILIKLLINLTLGEQVWENEFFNEAFSSGIPIISESVSIIIGIKLLGIKFVPLLHRENYDGGTVTKLVVLSLGLQTVTSYAVMLLEALLEKAGLSSPTLDLTPTTSLPANLMFYFYACILGPILEEMLYRGILLQSMRKYNERFAVFFSAMIFGLMHQNYQQFIGAFVFGIPLAIIAVRYNSILPTIIAHIICNTSAVIVQVGVQSVYPEYFNLDLKELTLLDIPPAAMAVLLINLFFRLAVTLAALIIGVLALAKGGYLRRPTPAGKSRALPVVASSALWWVLISVYIILIALPLVVSAFK